MHRVFTSVTLIVDLHPEMTYAQIGWISLWIRTRVKVKLLA